MSQPYNPFEKLLNDLAQGYGQKKLDTVPLAPADSGDTPSGSKNVTDTRKPTNPWPGVVIVAVILGFLYAIAWLVITHVS